MTKKLKSKLPNNFYAGESSTGNFDLQQQQPQKQQTVEAPPQPSLEELVRQMTMQNMQFQ